MSASSRSREVEGNQNTACRARMICPRCCRPLVLRVGVCSRTGVPYDFFACSNAHCANTGEEGETRELRGSAPFAFIRKWVAPERIVSALLMVEALVLDGESICSACRRIGIGLSSYYRWRQEYGGMDSEQVSCVKKLKMGNRRLKRASADLNMEQPALPELPAQHKRQS